MAETARVAHLGRLADALWPNRLPPTWSAALRGVVTEGRRLLVAGGIAGDDVVATVRCGYEMLLPPGVTTDLDVTRDALAEASAYLAAGNGRDAAEAARRASSLAGLSFLPEHDGEWVEGIRRELRRVHLRSLSMEAQARAMMGDTAEANDAASRLVELEPFDEGFQPLPPRRVWTRPSTRQQTS
jgi:DNA-binding SARP family transcriptional activator